MLRDAIEEILRELQAAADRRHLELRRRADVRRVDEFLLSIEAMIEHRPGVVPPLMEEISGFVRPVSRKLLRALNGNVPRPGTGAGCALRCAAVAAAPTYGGVVSD